MPAFNKIALASLKVFKNDLETSLAEALEELGIGSNCKKDQESLLETLELKREKTIKKINRFFDGLKSELSEEKSNGSSMNFSESKALEDIALSIKELRHQFGQLQQDLNDLKSKS